MRTRVHGNKGKHHTEETKKKISINNARYWKGKNLSEETKIKIGTSGIGLHIGSKNGMWKANNVSYRALHNWVERNLGKPIECEFCGKEKTTPKSIHWANKSRQYKRDLIDWISLCVVCHKKYDMANRRSLTYSH